MRKPPGGMPPLTRRLRGMFVFSLQEAQNADYVLFIRAAVLQILTVPAFAGSLIVTPETVNLTWVNRAVSRKR